MPLRGILYILELYKIYADQRKINIYSSTLQRIPTPKFIVFYNGTKNEPDRHVERLSDAFIASGGCLECEATMLNINYGHNLELMKKCRPLEEYSIFVATVRKYTPNETLSNAERIDLAIEECLNEGILVDILTTQRAEVHAMILETFDKELYEKDLIETTREEALAEGLATGRLEGENHKLLEQISKKLAKGKSVDEIAEDLEESLAKIEELIQTL